MIFTLAWKEMREHQGIWITMIFMSVVLGLGLSKLVSLGDAHLAVPVAALTILGMAATYGVVCGAMMFAGEHEGGTLVFLDVFLGRRGLLWMGKFAIGAVLVLTQALAVALILGLLDHQAPHWAMAIVGQSVNIPMGGGQLAASSAWLVLLPVVTLEAFVWGLLGSSMTKRVLAGAAVAAVGFTPVLLLALCAPSEIFVGLRLAAIGVCLVVSCTMFVGRSDEATFVPAPEPNRRLDPKKEFFDQWEKFERTDDRRASDAPAPSPAWADVDWPATERSPAVPEVYPDEPSQAKSPGRALWWLTFEQARAMLWFLGVGSLLMALIIPGNSQVLWPLASLLLGVVCGAAAFAPEQRDHSYQFLAAQHFPLNLIWRFKIVFWFAVAVLAALTTLVGAVLIQAARGGPLFHGTLRDLMGSTLFFGVFLFYGFSTAQVIVWLCRKTILALLVSFLVAVAALGFWLPSLLCGGMGGWQLWATPLAMLAATSYLMRAWAGGRIWERQPTAALVEFSTALAIWALINFGYRAWEVPNVGAPLNPLALRESLLTARDNAAARAIHQAITQLDEPNDPWLVPMAEVTRLPAGVLEIPRRDGQMPGLLHLPACEMITDRLLVQARHSESGSALEYLAQILALSRNLRNKAPLESYLAGVREEEAALTGLDQWLARGKPDPKLLRRALDELNRHATETPPPLDCVETECFRSGGLVAEPSLWTFAAPGAGGKAPEPWLKGSIALSLETPWEAERKTRLWQLVWAGLFRAVKTPHWQQPANSEPLPTEKAATQRILQSWLGDDTSLTRAHVARLLDRSWLADERLFVSVVRLRDAATRARWRVDAKRQAIALALFRIEEGKPVNDLQDLVPKYFPSGLPIDAYSGATYRYGIGPDGNEAVWSTGPDRIDHGGQKHGGHLADDDPRWANGSFDLIISAPQWP